MERHNHVYGLEDNIVKRKILKLVNKFNTVPLGVLERFLVNNRFFLMHFIFPRKSSVFQMMNGPGEYFSHITKCFHFFPLEIILLL
jgi:hypothetical protein